MDLAAGPVAPAEGPDESHLDGPVCERCGEPNSERARFCQRCGTLLVPETESAEDRWSGLSHAAVIDSPTAPIVTAVVCELSDPNAGAAPTGEEGAPWNAGEMLDEVRATLTRLGGAVQDAPDAPNAVVAIFGPEPAEGDGPVRAVRAAGEIRDVLGERSAGLRAGVGTSEVMGEGPAAERLWQERVVDLAIRLQRMASPGEVIVGEGVYRRIGNAAELEPVDSHARIEDDEPVGPLRLLEVSPDASARALAQAPLIGRDAELAALREAFDRAVAARAGELVRVTGEAGIGRTRLVEDFVRALEASGEASVVRVRCEGAAWPLAQIVEGAAELAGPIAPGDARAALERVVGEPDAAQVADRLLPALGLPGFAVPEETPWALRRLFEGAARQRPLVVFFDDVGRVGERFARVLRDVARGAREGPILIVCTAGPDGATSEAGDVIALGPLHDTDVLSLVDELLPKNDLTAGARDAIARAAAGNPFVVEQLLATLIDAGHLRLLHRRWVANPGVASLTLPLDAREILSTRLQGLEIGERAVIGLSAVLGETFPQAPLADLVGEEERADLDGHLSALVAKRLLRTDGTAGTAGAVSTYAFRHALVREATLAEVPAELRGDVHERYAHLLEDIAGEHDPLRDGPIAAHLDAACRFLQTEAGEPLARRTAELLSRTGRTAAELGDPEGAVAMLERAASLLPPDELARAELLLETAVVLSALGDRAGADGKLAQTLRITRGTGDLPVESRAKLLRAELRAASTPDLDSLETLREAADEAIATCTGFGDEAGLAHAWSARVVVHRRLGHWTAAATAAERAAEHAERAGLRREAVAALRDVARAIDDGPDPLSESVARCEAVLERLRGERPAEQEVVATLALMLARQGKFDRAREMVSVAAEELDRLGLEAEALACRHRSARIEVLAGRSDEAERILRRALDGPARTAVGGVRAGLAAALAQILVDDGRVDEANELTDLAAHEGRWEDVATQVAWRTARAKALALTDEIDTARSLARDAVRLAEQTDLIELRCGALLDLADVLRLCGRPNEAVPFARRALRSLERKGAKALATRARALLEHPKAPLTTAAELKPEPAAVEPEPEPAAVETSEPEISFSNLGPEEPEVSSEAVPEQIEETVEAEKLASAGPPEAEAEEPEAAGPPEAEAEEPEAAGPPEAEELEAATEPPVEAEPEPQTEPEPEAKPESAENNSGSKFWAWGSKHR